MHRSSRDNNNLDDLNDIDDEQLEAPVTMELGFDKIIVVDNIPQVPQEKYEKLRSVLSKVFNAFGNVKDLFMAQDNSGATKGFAFVEYSTHEEAEASLKANGYRLDKSHIFKVNMYDDLQKYSSVPDTYTPPEIKPFEAKENLGSWLLDERDIDQYAVRYQDMTEILWNDLKLGEEPEVEVRRQNWTDSYVAWSPRGTYLLTMHQKGVAIWGGPKWDKLMRFPHNGVKLIDFSPCERYLVTASPQYQENDNPKDPQCIIVWDVRSGRKLRGFSAGSQISWPVFKWSHDDAYLGRISEDTISIYETPSMDLLEKRSLKVEGVKDFAWSPSDHIISYFVPESSNKPASVVLIEIPSRKEKRVKNLFNVTDCKMHWHPSGDFLCVKVDRQKKKTTYTDFELFRMREKDIPTEQVEVKENIVAFAWEPEGNKFAIIHGDLPKPDVSFYGMEKTVRHLKTLEKRSANHLFWSPRGGIIVLAGLHSLNGTLEFFNANDMETMGNEEHFMATVVDWDPSGRYVSTVVSYWRQQLENGYNIYSFSGKLLKHVLKDKFYQLLWRPRPPTLLAREKLEEIKRDIGRTEKYNKERDKEKRKQELEDRRRKRQAMREEFEGYLQQRQKDYLAEKDLRRRFRGGEDTDDEENTEVREEWVEEIEDVMEIPIEEH